ncbi:hypothetical protein A2903_00410 [Candidatus Nomurabacteria bacterium RIFCSPLOWO2_01_FULL_33_17]|uniref:SH3b domain-containing protein n=1 Tax=Candidatus Nomurabacteria bacterium RIFCSPLOWO2_01_FULL_33_17 TaxID=1801764 RepID=A0A1F6WQ57_9BACT|nr:MAG: hypothetical protein A2903_00410 [Candidatus Nomurabacteria bacterium RIFCSPLOWO2_01_FULL_33_17]
MKKFLLTFIFLFIFTPFAYSATVGTISTTNKYAKIYAGENAGTQINFRPNDTASVQAIEVHNDRIRGYAWGQATGWIVFSCEDTANACTDGEFKVANDGNGNLSGYAWGQATGWISFSCSNSTSNCSTGAGSWGVSITSGQFSGYAWSQNFGYIQFNCNVSGACLSTDWAPTSSTQQGGAVLLPQYLEALNILYRGPQNLLPVEEIVPDKNIETIDTQKKDTEQVIKDQTKNQIKNKTEKTELSKTIPKKDPIKINDKFVFQLLNPQPDSIPPLVKKENFTNFDSIDYDNKINKANIYAMFNSNIIETLNKVKENKVLEKQKDLENIDNTVHKKTLDNIDKETKSVVYLIFLILILLFIRIFRNFV